MRQPHPAVEVVAGRLEAADLGQGLFQAHLAGVHQLAHEVFGQGFARRQQRLGLAIEPLALSSMIERVSSSIAR